MKRKSLNRLLVSLLALCGIIYVATILIGELREASQAGLTPAGAALPKIEELGDPKAQIHAELFVPVAIDCHAKTLELIRKYVNEHPGQVRATFLPLGLPEVSREMRARGLQCATVFINGEYSFLLEEDGKPRRVTFDHQPNIPGCKYTSEEVIQVLDQKLGQPTG